MTKGTHGNGRQINALFCDSHIESLKLAEFRPGFIPRRVINSARSETLGSDKVKISDNAIRVLVGERGYLAVIGEQLLPQIGEHCHSLGLVGRCAIICDENVASLFADRISQSLASANFEPVLITVAPGEKEKSLERAGKICDQMIAAGLDRTSFVIALGGGVVGDLAGFVAAIFHRGIPWVNIPTTLLAQVDSCIGGKTGVTRLPERICSGSCIIQRW